MRDPHRKTGQPAAWRTRRLQPRCTPWLAVSSARSSLLVWSGSPALFASQRAAWWPWLVGATPEGKKELVGFQTGVRESAQSWRELLIDIKRRGLEIAPDIAVGDGALGFWKAVEEVFPGTKHQRCWVHKIANVLNKVALSVQVNMKDDLREIYGAPTRAAAEVAIDAFAEKYGAKYEKAVACLIKDRVCSPSSTSRPSIGTISAHQTRSRACSPRYVIGRCAPGERCRRPPPS
jgi:hypothetical protein